MTVIIYPVNMLVYYRYLSKVKLELNICNLRPLEKDFFVCFQEKKKCRKISPDWSSQESFISCLGNLCQDYHINQSFLVKKKNKQ